MNTIKRGKLIVKTILWIVSLWPIAFHLQGCKKLVEVQPPVNSLTSDNVYENDATAATVLTGIYIDLSKSGILNASSISSISLVTGLSSDELTLYGGAANFNSSLVNFYLYHLTGGSQKVATSSIWNDLYSKIYITNVAIDRLNNSNGLTAKVKEQLIGEAKFLRAFFYFYLVNLYGDVPLAITSDYKVNAGLSRSPTAEVYKQIITDLKDAESLLNENYLNSDAKTISSERVRPTKWAAASLLARSYLYSGDWENAEKESTVVISNKMLFSLDSLNGVFLKNSKEAIWQIQPVNIGWNTEDAKVFILPTSGPTSNSTVIGYPVYLSDRILHAFEVNDLRQKYWTNYVTVGSSSTYYYPYKYKSAKLNTAVTEYTMVVRLGEQYLIRAEARAHLNKISEGLADLNVIRQRAGLPDATASDQNSLLTLIYHERQVELFTEWGHRWLDLKRSGIINNVMNNVSQNKGISWNTNWQVYPIPNYDIYQNPNLTQNPGY